MEGAGTEEGTERVEDGYRAPYRRARRQEQSNSKQRKGAPRKQGGKDIFTGCIRNARLKLFQDRPVSSSLLSQALSLLRGQDYVFVTFILHL